MHAKDELKRTTLRIPAHLYSRVEKSAQENGRSLNSEIMSTLNDAYPPDPYEAIEMLEEELLRVKDDPERENYRQILLYSLKFYQKKERAKKRQATRHTTS